MIAAGYQYAMAIRGHLLPVVITLLTNTPSKVNSQRPYQRQFRSVVSRAIREIDESMYARTGRFPSFRDRRRHCRRRRRHALSEGPSHSLKKVLRHAKFGSWRALPHEKKQLFFLMYDGEKEGVAV